MTDYAKLSAAARDAVALASRVCRQVQHGLDEVRAFTKDDKSPVTIADLASQAVVAWALRERLGGVVHLVGEETSAFLRNPEHKLHLDATLAAARVVWPDADEKALLDAIDAGAGDTHHAGFWTLDPIDGTKGFLRKQQYAVSLAYIERGTPVVGALGCPNLARDFAAGVEKPDAHGTLYLALKGQGTYEVACDRALAGPGGAGGPGGAETPVHIRRTDHAPGEPVVVCMSVEEAHSSTSDTSRVMSACGEPGEPVRLDSQCKYAVVARGQADAYLRLPTKKGYVERIWDHAAGALVATEAGCVVSDVRGRPLDFSHGRGLEQNVGVVCAPPAIHAKLIHAIAELGIGRA